MKSSLVFAFSILGASTALAAAPDPVVGSWRALPPPGPAAMIGVIGIPKVLTFTDDGRLWAATRLPSRVIWFDLPGHGRPGAPRPEIRPSGFDQLLGRYTSRDGKIVAKGPAGETYAYELMKDGRLCVYPGPGMLPLGGPVKPTDAGRQCYQRLQTPA